MAKANGLGDRQDHLRSKSFGHDGKQQWCLILYPYGTSQTYGHVGVYLHALEDVHAHVIFSISALDNIYEDVPGTKVEHSVNKIPKATNWGFPKYLTVLDSEDFKKFMSCFNDKFRIKCEVKVFLGITQGPPNGLQFQPGVTTLADDVKAFCARDEAKNVVVAAGGQDFRASKVALQARCKAIGAALQDIIHPVIEIADCSGSIVANFLQYLHNDRCALLEKKPVEFQEVVELFILAHRYEFTVSMNK
eukprot:GHVU01048806.1.p1 GENE.GHVU01048806.1~~GHVU01048806.1.p1  ORF type:complete len:273 (-),score=38.71 GHVU01048806.1:664-1407(-)